MKKEKQNNTTPEEKGSAKASEDLGATKSANEEPKDQMSEFDEMKSQLQRLQAEFDNYRRRTDAERGDLKEVYKGQVIEKLIPILDHFELALKHDCSDKNYAMGIEMIHASFKELLRSEGVEEIVIKGKKFDPKLAEVIETKEEKDQDDDIVLDVQFKGYQLKNKVLRRARVIVNKKKSA